MQDMGQGIALFGLYLDTIYVRTLVCYVSNFLYPESKIKSKNDDIFIFSYIIRNILTSIRHCLTYFIHIVETGIESEIVVVTKVWL
jgi:hypothetical protein